MTGNTITRGVALAALVMLAAVAGTAMGAWNGQVTTSDDTPGAEDVTYTIYATAGDDMDEVNLHNDSIVINFQYTPLTTGEIGPEDIELLAVDNQGDLPGTQFNDLLTAAVEDAGPIDEGDVGAATQLEISVNNTITSANEAAIGDTATTLDENDEVIIQLSNITNPEAGEYPMLVDLSSSTAGGEAEMSLSIEEEQQTTMPNTTAATTTESGDGGPGFTVVLGVIAVLAAALVAVRRT